MVSEPPASKVHAGGGWADAGPLGQGPHLAEPRGEGRAVAALHREQKREWESVPRESGEESGRELEKAREGAKREEE